jgi:hypothetical protein
VGTVLFLIFIIVIIILIRNGALKTKGKIGEQRVAMELDRELQRNSLDYKTLNDIMLQTDRGTVQIDHIVILPWGLLVVETKNFSGWIFGDENSKYWTQVIYNDKHRFYNPIKQNSGHIAVLKRVLGDFDNRYWKLHYKSLIVFDNGCKLKKINTTTPVIYKDELKKFIALSVNEFTTFLSRDEIEKIYQFLKNINITDEHTRRQHIKNIRKKNDENRLS